MVRAQGQGGFPERPTTTQDNHIAFLIMRKFFSKPNSNLSHFNTVKQYFDLGL